MRLPGPAADRIGHGGVRGPAPESGGDVPEAEQPRGDQGRHPGTGPPPDHSHSAPRKANSSGRTVPNGITTAIDHSTAGQEPAAGPASMARAAGISNARP